MDIIAYEQPITELQRLGNEVIDHLIDEAVDKRHEASSDAQQAFYNFLQPFPIAGFRAKSKVPTKHLITLCKRLKTVEAIKTDLFSVVTQLWYESSPVVMQIRETIIKLIPDFMPSPIFPTHLFQRAMAQSEFNQLISWLFVQHPYFGQDDIRMAAGLVLNIFPIEDADFLHYNTPRLKISMPTLSNFESGPEITSLLGTQLLEAARTEPSDSLFWDEVVHLLIDLQLIADGKLMERNAGREHLEACVNRLRPHTSYFADNEVAQIETWAFTHITTTDAFEYAGIVEQVLALIERYDTVGQLPSTTLKETQAKRQNMIQLEESIVNLMQYLDKVLSTLNHHTVSKTGGQFSDKDSGTITGESDTQGVLIEELAEASSFENIPEVRQANAFAGEVTDHTFAYELPDTPSEIELLSEIDSIDTVTGQVFEQDDHFFETESTFAIDNATDAAEQIKVLSIAAQMSDNSVQDTLTLANERDALTLWDMIATGDWSGAYWVLKSMPETDTDLPADLLAVMTGVRLLHTDAPQLSHDIAQRVQNIAIPHDPSGQLLLTGAAIRGVLSSSNTGLDAWLLPNPLIQPLHFLIQEIRQFTTTGTTLDSHSIDIINGNYDLKAERIQLQDVAEQRIQELKNQTFSYQPATQVWRQLMMPHKGDLRELLEIVAQNDIKRKLRMRELLTVWTNEDALNRRISEIDRTLRGNRPRIDFDPLRNIKERAARITELAQTWQRQVDLVEAIPQRGTWTLEQIQRLCQAVESSSQAIFEEIAPYHQDTAQPKLQAATLAFARQFTFLLSLLNIPLNSWNIFTDSPRWNPATDFDPSITQLMMGRLLWASPTPLPDDLAASNSNILLLAGRAVLNTYTSENITTDAVKRWIEAHDYRFVEQLLENVRNTDIYAPLHTIYKESLEDDRYNLLKQHDALLEQIERAIVNGLISDNERAAYLADRDRITPEITLNIQLARKKIEEISNQLTTAQDNRSKTLWEKWVKDKLTWKRNLGEDLNRWIVVEERINQAFQKQDTRAIEEYFDHLSSVDITTDEIMALFENKLDATKTFEVFWKEYETFLQSLENFRGFTATWLKAHSKDAARIRLERVEKVALVWNGLKGRAARTLSDADLLREIKTLCEFFEFEFTNTAFQSPITLIHPGREGIHLRADMRINSELVRPIAQLGSEVKGGYEVFGIWERPNADTLGSYLSDHNLDTTSILVFYFGRMSTGRRKQLMANAHNRNLPVIVVDEVMLAYVAVEYLKQNQSPMRALMNYALPFAYIQPYRPGNAGSVPPEIFYGRTKMVTELQKSEVCIVYGGRQLGKSALLKHVALRFNEPSQERFAHVEDIKSIGDIASGIPVTNIWYRIRDYLKLVNLLPKQSSSVSIETIVLSVKEAFLKRPSLRVILLFDESDNFLESDSETSFTIVDQIRTLMVQTDRRFKVVFAGLHSVQRFQSIPNQPLAHFGKPIVVGPLNPADALQLVQEPFTILGFGVSNDIALRILSYTNYHSGLIQLFCKELLTSLLNKQPEQLPYIVTRSDVESVYLRPDVRTSIRERFTWTLALDTRYQAVAWSMIENQMTIRDSYAQEYSVGQILDLVKLWWPEGFEGTEINALLDEMRGLGILSERNGLHRLRSPNLVRLMGEENVEQSLLELSEIKTVNRRLITDHVHSLLNTNQLTYSALTIAQERAISSGVASTCMMVIPSIHMVDIQATLRPILATNLSEDEKRITEVKLFENGKRFVEKMRHAIDHNPACNHFIFFHICTTDSYEQLPDLVRKASDFTMAIRNSPDSQKSVRVIFVADITNYWHWLSLMALEDYRDDKWLDTVIEIKPWTKFGIGKALGALEILTQELENDILQKTAGWHPLVEVAIQQTMAKRGQQERPRAVELSTSLVKELFYDKLDLKSIPEVEKTLRFFCQLAPGEAIPESFADDIPDITPDTARRVLILLKRTGFFREVHGQGEVMIDPIIHRFFS